MLLISAAARAHTQELINDQLGLAAALIGMDLLAAGVPIADPIAAILVATVSPTRRHEQLRANSGTHLAVAPETTVESWVFGP